MTAKTISRLPEVMARTGLKRSTIYSKMGESTFPSKIKLGSRAVGWVDDEIQDWIQSRIDSSRPEDSA